MRKFSSTKGRHFKLHNAYLCEHLFLETPTFGFFFRSAQSNVSCKKIRKLKIGADIKASGLQYIDPTMKNDISTIQ